MYVGGKQDKKIEKNRPEKVQLPWPRGVVAIISANG
jgi:hypothetical protein